MANYNYITTGVIDVIDSLAERATITSSRGYTCELEYDEPYVSIWCDGCGYSAHIDATGMIIFKIMLALHASLKLDKYGIFRLECSSNPNTVWYWGNKLIAIDSEGNKIILCED